MKKKININFLTKKAQEEFIKIYGENYNEDNIFWFTKTKCNIPFDIDNIVFEAIKNIKEIKPFGFNIKFTHIDAIERNNERFYFIYFWFSNEHFDYLPGDTDTTEVGIKEMNEKFKFKNIGKIDVSCGELEAIIKINK